MPDPAATYLGIDLGTSAVKALLTDAAQDVLASATVALRISRPQPGWSEQAPQDWWQAVGEAIAMLRQHQGAALGRVAAIGLSGQMHGLVLLDQDRELLAPAILWNDSRAGAQADAITALHPDWAGITGAAQSPSFWPAKLLWLREHEPERLARAAHLLLPKDYLRLRITGTLCTDPCDAGGTLLFDEAERAWSAPILAACGIDAAQLPQVLEGNASGGTLLAAVAEAWGIGRQTVIVAGGGGDAAAGAIGIGAVRDGDAYISLGTSAQVTVTTDSYRPATGTGVQSFAHGLPGLWFQAGAVLNGASALAWAARLFGQDNPAALLEQAAAAYRGPGDLLFLPYLTGERTPHNDPHARGVLFGLTPETAAPQVIQAVIEGVAYSLADALDALGQAGTRIELAALVGGGGRSGFWAQIIADVLGIPLVRYRGVETGPAFGAARLARLALTGEPPHSLCTAPEILERLQPDPERHARYGERLQRFRALYQALRGEFRR